jgi:hypothetical protein
VIPLRSLFRSRWAALAWAASICWTAASFAGGDDPLVDAASSPGNSAAEAAALLAELPD